MRYRYVSTLWGNPSSHRSDVDIVLVSCLECKRVSRQRRKEKIPTSETEKSRRWIGLSRNVTESGFQEFGVSERGEDVVMR